MPHKLATQTKIMRKSTRQSVIVRALRTRQGKGLDVYAFFMRGSDIVKVADISRVERDESNALKGFQRPEIKTHVRGIVDYLNQGAVLFPNAIILAISPQIRFKESRGTKPEGDQGLGVAGTLEIPVFDEGQRIAWIVDGQQRSMALAQANNKNFPVPVIAFISDDLGVQREQFILVNKARPLPARLINELLPETSAVLLPRELSSRKIPSQLCETLNRDPNSPFHQIIRRMSDQNRSPAVVTDTAVINMIKHSLNNPLGALAPYRTSGRDHNSDLAAMYRVLLTFWSAVREVFSGAWGLDSRSSRLMHSAGIEAMGVLMDRIYGRMAGSEADAAEIKRELLKVAPDCHWTKGTWTSLGLGWNEIQSTPRDIKRLQDALVQIYNANSRR
ncbi:MAG: DGQHR domain-containing protein DpdB [Nevskia sp.]|nr:DGQHR domain-containing protein DpdB [Nevskia sp.]